MTAIEATAGAAVGIVDAAAITTLVAAMNASTCASSTTSPTMPIIAFMAATGQQLELFGCTEEAVQGRELLGDIVVVRR